MSQEEELISYPTSIRETWLHDKKNLLDNSDKLNQEIYLNEETNWMLMGEIVENWQLPKNQKNNQNSKNWLLDDEERLLLIREAVKRKTKEDSVEEFIINEYLRIATEAQTVNLKTGDMVDDDKTKLSALNKLSELVGMSKKVQIHRIEMPYAPLKTNQIVYLNNKNIDGESS